MDLLVSKFPSGEKEEVAKLAKLSTTANYHATSELLHLVFHATMLKTHKNIYQDFIEIRFEGC